MYMGLAPSGCTEFKRTLSERIGTFCESAGEEGEPVELFRRLVADGLDRLPLPGAGNTIERWRALAAAAGHDLSLAKLFEGHTDALAILAELHAPAEEDGSRWAVWAAESRRARLTIARQDGQQSASPDARRGARAPPWSITRWLRPRSRAAARCWSPFPCSNPASRSSRRCGRRSAWRRAPARTSFLTMPRIDYRGGGGVRPAAGLLAWRGGHRGVLVRRGRGARRVGAGTTRSPRRRACARASRSDRGRAPYRRCGVAGCRARHRPRPRGGCAFARAHGARRRRGGRDHRSDSCRPRARRDAVLPQRAVRTPRRGSPGVHAPEPRRARSRRARRCGARGRAGTRRL